MKVYTYNRNLLRVNCITGHCNCITGQATPLTEMGYIFMITSNRCLTYENGEWERYRSALPFQFHMLGVSGLRHSSLLEFLLATGKSYDEIPLTRWERVIERVKKWWKKKKS